MSRMLWFTWRQQRTTAIGAAAAVAALPVSLVSLNSPAWPGAQWRLTWLALLAVPCLAGMFIGAPMFAAELEHSIHRLALAQSVTRLGLIVPRLILVMAPLPAERFWTFQAIESEIFLALAANLLCHSLNWIFRRIG